jgi:hypothetical protein
MERNFNLSLEVSDLILDEINEQLEKTINRYNISEPNEAKLASSVAFWIRKLKPIHHASDSDEHYKYINELCGLLFSMMIYANDNRKNKIDVEKLIDLSKMDRIFIDLIKSYRYNSHSSHSSTIIFELLFNCKSSNMAKVANKKGNK